MTHHLHPNPDVDDMLRAANARAEAAEGERDTLDALRKEALNQRDAAERRLAAIKAVHERYFDLDGEPGFDDTTPEPEDVWRYDRDFRAALTAEAER